MLISSLLGLKCKKYVCGPDFTNVLQEFHCIYIYMWYNELGEKHF